MTNHEEEDHDGKEAEWKFTVKRRYNSAMYRQISEAVMIRRAEALRGKKKIKILNNKLEYSRCILPELEVSMGGKMMIKKMNDEIREEIKKKEEENRIDERGRDEVELEENKKRGREYREKQDEGRSNKRMKLHPSTQDIHIFLQDIRRESTIETPVKTTKIGIIANMNNNNKSKTLQKYMQRKLRSVPLPQSNNYQSTSGKPVPGKRATHRVELTDSQGKKATHRVELELELKTSNRVDKLVETQGQLTGSKLHSENRKFENEEIHSENIQQIHNQKLHNKNRKDEKMKIEEESKNENENENEDKIKIDTTEEKEKHDKTEEKTKQSIEWKKLMETPKNDTNKNTKTTKKSKNQKPQKNLKTNKNQNINKIIPQANIEKYLESKNRLGKIKGIQNGFGAGAGYQQKHCEAKNEGEIKDYIKLEGKPAKQTKINIYLEPKLDKGRLGDRLGDGFFSKDSSVRGKTSSRTEITSKSK